MSDILAEPTGPTAAELAAERKRLFDIVKDSADKNRNYFLAWLLFSLYVLVTVAGTSDTQLLLPDIGVSLPVLGIQLPLFSFYLAAPLLVIAVHFNMLQNLDSHAYKLDRWRAAWGGSPPRDELQAFLFDFAFLEKGGAFDIPVRIASDLLFYWFGPIVLLAILVRFSDYQDATYTGYHFAALMVGLVLTLRARQRVPHPLESRVRRRFRRLFPFVAATIIALLALPTVWLVSALSANQPLALRFMWSLTNRPVGNDFLSELLVPRLILPTSAQLPGPDAQMELKARTEGRTVDEWWKDQGHGVDLSNRNLRFAIFNGVELRKADFRRAQLTAASFYNVKLQGAIFQGAQMPSAYFFYTQAQGSDFLMADLRAATFINSDLTAANLFQTAMEGAWFNQSRLLDADLRVATFWGGSFQDVTDAALSAEQRGQLLKLSSKPEKLSDDDRRELSKRLPTADAVRRLQPGAPHKQPVVPDLDPSTLTPDARDQALDRLVGAWCGAGVFVAIANRFAPTMVDKALSGWPGIDSVWNATDEQKALARSLRVELFERLIRSKECAAYKGYVCGRLKARDQNQPPLWLDLQKTCEEG